MSVLQEGSQGACRIERSTARTSEDETVGENLKQYY
jgi:hypothetical protein